MNKFELQIRLGMGDCDPAGIVYYPRYTEMLSRTVEEWFTTALAYSFHKLHVIDKCAIPTVDLHIKFIAPSFLSETLTFKLSLVALKNKSFVVKILAEHQGELRISAVSSLVFCKMLEGGGIKSQEIPVALRQKMQLYLTESPKAEN